jgi:hypothetical protein
MPEPGPGCSIIEEKPMRQMTTVLALLMLFPLGVNAQTAAEPPSAPESDPAFPSFKPEVIPAPAPTVAPSPPPAVTSEAPATMPAAASPITFAWEALVDAYYLYNFTGDPKNQAPMVRAFDNTANNFALNYAKLGVHADTERVSFRLDFGGGHIASISNRTSVATSTPAPSDTSSLYDNGFLVQQAFATVRPTTRLSIDTGKFVTSGCAEVLETNKNWLYSRSLIFFVVPGMHTGLRINGALLGTIATPELIVSLQIVNGWNTDPDINTDKTYGLNLTYTPLNGGTTAAATAYIGKEADGQKLQLWLDGVFLKDIGPLSVGANVSYLKRDTAYLIGVSGMGRFIINPSFYLAARVEAMRSHETIFLPVDGYLYEVTTMAAWTVDKHYELRLEFRTDLSDQKIFAKGDTPRKNQVTGLLGALAQF